MPDPSSLYPQPPQPGQGNMLSDPTKVLGLLGQVNALQQFQQTFDAKKAVGEIVGRHIKNGVLDEKGAIQEIAGNPRAAFGAPEAVGSMLARQGQQLSNTGQQISNTTNQFNQGVAQSGFVASKLAGLADKPEVTDEDLNNFVVQASRNTGVPSSILNGWMRAIPKDPAGRKAALAQMATSIMSPEGAAAPAVTGYEGAAPISGTAGQAALVRRGAVPGAPGISTPQPGLAETQTSEAQAGQQAATGLQNAANEIPTQRTQLDLMRKDLKDAETKFGPTSGYEKAANVVANRVLGFHPTMTKEEIAGLESFDKVGKQIAMSQAGSLHATDATLSTALGANPNSNLSAFGNEGIINMLHGNADAIAAKARAWNQARQSGTGPDKFYQWSDKFNKEFDPRVFQFMRMNKDQQGKLLSTIDDKAEFENRLVEADKKGWIKLPKSPSEKRSDIDERPIAGQQYAMMDNPRGPRPKPQLADQFGGGGGAATSPPGGAAASRSEISKKAFRAADQLRRSLGVTASTPGGRATDEALKAIEEALKLHGEIKPF